MTVALYTLLCGLVAIPLIVFIHELGHALAALVVWKGDVNLTVGDAGRSVRVRIGRLRIRLYSDSGPDGPHLGLVTIPTNRLSPAGHLWFSLGGPAASLVGAVATGYLAFIVPEGAGRTFLVIATLEGLVFGVGQLLPRRRAGVISDGWWAMAALRRMLTRPRS
jgi:hypothetical protein